MIIGARGPLIAFNVYLNTSDVEIAQAIALKIRESNGGLPYLKALGLLVGGQAQVSLNIVDYRQTSLYAVMDALRTEADNNDVVITHTELVGLMPQAALIDYAIESLGLPPQARSQTLEQRLGAATGDYDNDGWEDLYVTCFGANRLYRNNGDGTFTDVARKAGVDDPRWSTGAVFGDYNNDGLLDLFVANYINLKLDALPEFGKGKYCQFQGISAHCGPAPRLARVAACQERLANDGCCTTWSIGVKATSSLSIPATVSLIIPPMVIVSEITRRCPSTVLSAAVGPLLSRSRTLVAASSAVRLSTLSAARTSTV